MLDALFQLLAQLAVVAIPIGVVADLILDL